MSESVANAGANVAILFHSHPKAHESAENVAKKYGVKVKAYQCDVGDAKLVKQTIEHVEKDLGTPISALMANAGVSVVKPALELTTEDFHKVFNANVLGAFNASQAVAQHWVDKKFQGGSIVITSSMSSEVSMLLWIVTMRLIFSPSSTTKKDSMSLSHKSSTTPAKAQQPTWSKDLLLSLLPLAFV